MTKITGVHPYADTYPMLSDERLAGLAESIKENGLRLPIIVTPDGLILDGRNRAAACKIAGVEPQIEVYEGDDFAKFVVDLSDRRDLTMGARAMGTAMILAKDGQREDGKWKRDSIPGDSGHMSAISWAKSLQRAGTILDHAPTLAENVVNGDVMLNTAYNKAVEARDANRNKIAEAEAIASEEVEAREFIEARAPDLADEVGSGLQSYSEARDIWNRRNVEEAQKLAAEKAKKAKEEAEERGARSDLYSGIARGLQIIGGYGNYKDIPKLMNKYDPAELNPPQYEREFSDENLDSAARFIVEIKKWKKAKQ